MIKLKWMGAAEGVACFMQFFAPPQPVIAPAISVGERQATINRQADTCKKGAGNAFCQAEAVFLQD